MANVMMQVRSARTNSKLFARWIQQARDNGLLVGFLFDGVVRLGSVQDYRLMGSVPARCRVLATLRTTWKQRGQGSNLQAMLRQVTVGGHRVAVEVHHPVDCSNDVFLTGENVEAVWTAYAALFASCGSDDVFMAALDPEEGVEAAESSDPPANE